MNTLPDVLIWIVAALVGGAIGSFLNVCIYRLPEGESVVAPRSRCPQCSSPIAWYDNLPVISWILLRGRCRNCKAGISIQYPLVELVTMGLWVAAVVRYGISWQALSLAIFLTLLLGIALTDARTYTIPDEFSLGGLILGIMLSFAPGGITPLRSIAGAALGFTILFLIGWVGEWYFKKPAMGGGDIKMMAMIGSFLGPLGAILTLFLGALVGTIIFLPITLRTKKLVPFGIFLAIGAAVTEAWGAQLIEWYRTAMLGM